MSVHMRKHLTNGDHPKMIKITLSGINYLIPFEIADKYRVITPTKSRDNPTNNLSIKEAFADLIDANGEVGTLLKGLRAREGITQIALAKKINVTQANLSAMETGKRPI